MHSLLLPARAGVVAISLGLMQSPLLASNTPASPSDTHTDSLIDLAYHSVFTHYQRHSPAGITPWRHSNQVVLERGGWRTYAQETDTEPAVRHTHPNHEATDPTSVREAP